MHIGQDPDTDPEDQPRALKDAQTNKSLGYYETFRTTRNRPDIDEQTRIESTLFSSDTDFIARAALRTAINQDRLQEELQAMRDLHRERIAKEFTETRDRRKEWNQKAPSLA